ncbi:MAG: DNA polymerase III subunit beta [Smithella sp.]
MKFTVQKEYFLNAVNNAIRATANRQVQPILSNLLIESKDDDTIKITATDLDFWMILDVEAQVHTPGKLTVNARKLSEVVSKLNAMAAVDFEMNENILKLKSGKSKFELNTISADEFPTVPFIEGVKPIELNGNGLAELVGKVSYATDPKNGVLAGVNFNFDSNGIKLAATDGSRLSEVSSDLGVTNESLNVVVPTKALGEFSKLFNTVGDKSNPVYMTVNEYQIGFVLDNGILLARLLEGKYPTYQGIIPTESKHVIFADRREMVNSLDRVGTMASDRTNIAEMEISKGNICFKAKTQETGNSEDVIDAQYDGDNLSVAFNYRLMLDALKSISGDKVYIGLNTAMAPIVLKPVDADNHINLVMPVQMKS